MAAPSPIVIAYDGSTAARSAVHQAGLLFAPRHAIVLTAWEPGLAEFMLMPGAGGMGSMMMPYDPSVVRDIDRAAEGHAHDIAEDGAQLARSEGLIAEALAVRDTADTVDALVTAAEEHHAAAIVVGSRGLKGLKSKLLGSTSSGLLSRANCPVVVVRHPEDSES
jgi:nucleotide-binding universal stress UspA family protein